MKFLFALPWLVLAAGCGGSHTHGTIALIVTDAPVSFETVQRASVEIDRVTIDGGPYSLVPPRVLYDGPPISFDVASLRNGAMQHLLSRNVPLLTYRRLHIHFRGAELELKNGRVFTPADGSLQLPPAATGGIEVTIETSLTVTNGHWSRLLLDFDLPRSFVPQGSPDLEQADSVMLQPLLHAVRPGQTGEIRGLVLQADGSGTLAPVADATLYFLPSGTNDLELAVGSTGTDADGSYAKLGLPPGTYDVLAMKAGSQTTYSACLVTAASYGVVDLLLP